MKKPLGACVATVGLLASAPVVADEAVGADEFRRIAREMSDCLVFYQISIMGLRGRMDMEDTVVRYERAARRALYFSSIVGDEAGVSDQERRAWHLQVAQEMDTSINDSCANISVLISKYEDSCIALVGPLEGGPVP